MHYVSGLFCFRATRVCCLVLFYGIIVIHDIPYEIAKERDHPHQDAIHVAGWVSLFTLHAIWPFLWIWATLWRNERGWGFHKLEEEQHDLHHRLEKLIDQVSSLEQEVGYLKGKQAQEKAAAQTQSQPQAEEK
ncbi:GTPase [Vibrio maritimus]|uniref:GTPase n=2 Tax=Vibrio TaxID=662 RepID=A0A090RSU6_9VIBR|nr:GTPase [Vibrio maritimus]GAL27047.1 GTPase [Vibrio variabilis]